MHFLPLGIGLLGLWISTSTADNSMQANKTQILSPNVAAFINNILADWSTPGGAAVAVVRTDGQGG